MKKEGGQEFRSLEVREASSLHKKICSMSKIHLNQKRTINLGIICKNAQIWFCTSIIRKKTVALQISWVETYACTHIMHIGILYVSFF